MGNEASRRPDPCPAPSPSPVEEEKPAPDEPDEEPFVLERPPASHDRLSVATAKRQSQPLPPPPWASVPAAAVPPPDNGTRLSALCSYRDATLRRAGKWFSPARELSNIALDGAQRWGYARVRLLTRPALFREWKRRLLVLVGRHLCFLDGHEPDAKVRGGLDVATEACRLRLPPGPVDGRDACIELGRADASDGNSGGGSGGDGEDEWTVVLSFDRADELQAWMKAIFELQHRAATLRAAPTDPAEAELFCPSDDSVYGALPCVAVQASAAETATGIAPFDGSSSATAHWASDATTAAHSGAASGDSNSSGGGSGGIWRQRSFGKAAGAQMDGCGDANAITALAAPPADAQADEALMPEAAAAAAGAEGAARVEFESISGDRYVGAVQRLQKHGRGVLYRANGDIIIADNWRHDSLEGFGRQIHRCCGGTGGGRRLGSSRSHSGGGASGDNVSVDGESDRGCEDDGGGSGGGGSGSGGDDGGGGGSGGGGAVTTFEGDFRSGERHGRGRLILANGDIWQCVWDTGVVKAGTGSLITSTGDVYSGGCGPCSGDPLTPCCSGHGRLRWHGGDQLEANFVNGGVADGSKAVLRYRNGAIYFGQFRGGVPEGPGVVYLSSSGHSSGAAELDDLSAEIMWYKGDFQGGLPHGYGLVKWRDAARARFPVGASGSGSGGYGGGYGEQKEAELGLMAVRAGFDNPFDDDDEEEEDAAGTAAATGVGAGSADATPAPSPTPVPRLSDAAVEMNAETAAGASAAGVADTVSTPSHAARRTADVEAEASPLCESSTSSSPSPGRWHGGDGAAAARAAAVAARARERGGAAEDDDYEYEVAFRHGGMVRNDPRNLRLAALKFGRAEVRRLLKQQQQAEEALQRLRSTALCLICNGVEMNALLLRCAHRCTCVTCAALISDCPLCGKPIGGKIVRIYTT